MKIKNNDFIKTIYFMKNKAPVYFIFMIINNSIVSICYNIVLAFILKDVIDAITYRDIKLIYTAFFIAIISFFIAFILEPITMKIFNYCVRSTIRNIRKDTFKHIQDVQIDKFEEYSSGDLLSRLTKDIDSLENIYLQQIPNLCFAIIHGVVAIISMLCMSFTFGAIAIFLGLISVLVNYFVSKRIKNYSQKYQEEHGNLYQNIVDIEGGFIDIKMNCSENYFLDKIKKNIIVLKYNYEMRERYGVVLETINLLFENINTIGLMAFGLFMSLKGYVTIGVVVAVIRLQGNASYLFQNFSTFLGGIQKALPSARRVLSIFDLETEAFSSKCCNDISEIKRLKDYIKIDNVVFSYDGVSNILDRVSMHIDYGEFIGLIGESGNGKSTFAKILLGFHHPISGIYKLDGKDTNNIDLSEVRQAVGYVDQECVLFPMSIEDNIRLGNLNATTEEILEASKLANSHEFISKLEYGYNTIINENSDNISGGQRQRIALARALLSKRDILLIDEGTSEMDTETEKLISNTILSLKGKKTIIFITHKQEILEGVDRNYRFIEGKVEEELSTMW